MTPADKLKQEIWDFIYKFFLPLRKVLMKTGLIYHKKGRQKYHIGWLPSGKTLESLKKHLHDKWGFGNHFIAWIDEKQVLSWRKLTDFSDQYHLRVYEDGEICGHYEFTPEAHPLEHIEERGEREARADFLNFLGEFVTEKKYISHLEMDPNAFDPKSEISMETFQKK